MPARVIDWIGVGQSLVLLIIGCLSGLNTWRTKRTAKVIDEIKEISNGNTTGHLKTIAVATAALAASTHDPNHIKDAKAAQKEYDDHIDNQAQSKKAGP